MKKYISFFTAILLATSFLMAQTPEGRTRATIIADALAQLPAANQTQYNRTMADLVSTGEEGLLELIERMNPPGKNSNEVLDYAISGWTNFVANDETNRAIATSAYEKALSQQFHNVIKAMIIRQLEKIGTDNNVQALSTHLIEHRLVAPTAQALVSIGTENAMQALTNALANNPQESIKLNLVNALGQAGYEKAESLLIGELAKNPSIKYTDVLLSALSNVGGKNSLTPLKNAAQKINYSYQANNCATASYIALLSKISASEPKLVEKEANNLLKFAAKQNRTDLKVAASQLLMDIPSTNKTNILKAALKDGNKVYINNVLQAGNFENDNKAVKLILNCQVSQGCL